MPFQWRMFLGHPRTNRLRRSVLSPDSPVARFQQAVWCGRVPQRLPRPFGRNFKLILTVDLLREVSLIGTVHVPADEPDIPPAKPARSDRRKPGGESAAAWLVAR